MIVKLSFIPTSMRDHRILELMRAAREDFTGGIIPEGGFTEGKTLDFSGDLCTAERITTAVARLESGVPTKL